jgi:hypothetical protein
MNCPTHCRCHDEVLDNGQEIDVQVRLAPTGVTQIFIGVYAKGGMLHFEEAHEAPSSQTMTQAMLWGVSRARALATGIAAPGVREIYQARVS